MHGNLRNCAVGKSKVGLYYRLEILNLMPKRHFSMRSVDLAIVAAQLCVLAVLKGHYIRCIL